MTEHPDTPNRLHNAPRLHGSRLLLCITFIGWSERHAAHRCQMHRTAFRRCIDGKSYLAADLSAWLLDLESAMRDHRCPRARIHDPACRTKLDIVRDSLTHSAASQACASSA